MANCTWQDGRIFGDPLAPCGPLNTTNPVAACCAVGDVCLSDGNDILPDIKYQSDSTWVCCGTDAEGNRDCEHPTDEKFGAADKSALVTLWTAGVSTPTSAIVSSTALGTSSASGTPTQTAEPASSSDVGAFEWLTSGIAAF
ncbi:hypothetical protein PENARI_c003G05575 [Penicillium arizonense]|uniref:Uncharacterized protein n=1 Tax=Penicillium arizonense TaxID=1835702 RepID=A0A1F5LTX6_PENAI|nr:hypothetical protein PENARI_c003G05575 [Penicillium arizonense]OGE56635.1 hypothetical protein PENARI_c003G05575 [Penicillium arizonense]